MIARDRSQLADFLQSRLTGEYATGAAGKPSGGDAVPVKTYLLESHPPADADADQRVSCEQTLHQLLSEPLLQSRCPSQAYHSADDGLFTIEGSYRRRSPVHLYVDFLDSRFWLIHTLARSETADWIIGRLTRVGTGLARVALPGQLLEAAASLGAVQGLVTVHDRRMFVHDGSDPEGTDFMSMQLWGLKSRQVMSLLQTDDSLNECLSLSRVHVQYWPDEEDREAYCVDDIHCDGRLEARGTSIAAHLHLVNTIRDRYRRYVDRIESLYRVSSEAQHGTLSGRSATLRLSRPVGDAAVLIDTIRSVAPPFRYWGAATTFSAAYSRMRVLDLSVGGLLDFEITPDFIRVFLPAGSSASTVIRLYATLQRHLDSQVRWVGQDMQDVFELQA